MCLQKSVLCGILISERHTHSGYYSAWVSLFVRKDTHPSPRPANTFSYTGHRCTPFNGLSILCKFDHDWSCWHFLIPSQTCITWPARHASTHNVNKRGQSRKPIKRRENHTLRPLIAIAEMSETRKYVWRAHVNSKASLPVLWTRRQVASVSPPSTTS